MSWSTAAYALTALAGVVVVLTRLRLARTRTGAVLVNGLLLTLHTILGALGVVLWTVFLLTDEDLEGHDLIGLIGLGCLWVTALAGLGLLARWLPARGRHATAGPRGSWGGALLSLVAHLGFAVGTVALTWAYLTSAV